MKIIFKKIPIILILITILSCFSGCDNNSAFHLHIFKQKMDTDVHFMECACGESKQSEAHSFEWRSDYKHKECTACGYIKDEDTSVTVDKDGDGSIKLSDELLAGLKNYFANIMVQYDIGSASFEDKINSCKNDTRTPLMVKFSEKAYYVAAYYAASEGHYEHYCCYNDYTFVAFEGAEDVKESWDGKAIVGAFQVNPQELCVNIKTGESNTKMDHVSFYTPEFVDGVATDPEIDFDDFFIRLMSKDEDYVCYSSTRHTSLHQLGTLDCMELDGKYYVAEYHGSLYDGVDLERIYGKYYDTLASLLVDEYVIEEHDRRPRYGLYNLIDIVKIINE